ncbi:PREDICTED: uncharacterized protein LOC105454522 [Wasmannia auropunctata]|uniref:uncharacterized protein LOC105454522 n=1 Tax=Wasmannia auropunctata TaxID=64793 RepID=UPI0005EE5CF6|nr:PREDICTED: uncharacterized protein LOC105454522 [Wasmannia auropunctata]
MEKLWSTEVIVFSTCMPTNAWTNRREKIQRFSFITKIRSARAIFALHKMQHMPVVASSHAHLVHRFRVIAETTKKRNSMPDVTQNPRMCRLLRASLHIREVRMNGIESVVILTLPTRLRE